MKKYIFNSNSNGAYPILDNHSGQEVRIVRQLTDDECDIECQPMYKVKFDDGFIYDVFGDELEEI